MKRLCSSCISIDPFLPLPILSCFPSLCFFLSSPLSYSLSSLTVCKHFCVRGWDERKTGHILWGSQSVSSSEFAEAGKKHSSKCETFRWDLRLGIFKCFQCSAQTLELLWWLGYCQRVLAQSPTSVDRVDSLTTHNGLLCNIPSYDKHCCIWFKLNNIFHVWPEVK